LQEIKMKRLESVTKCVMSAIRIVSVNAILLELLQTRGKS
jgi:hypothetical protein